MDEYIKRTDAYNAILDELVGTGYQSGALRAIEFIPTADVAPKPEWISVDERLPDGNGRFLTVDRKGDMMVCYWEKRFGWFASVCNKNAITHWMPLPEPPKNP